MIKERKERIEALNMQLASVRGSVCMHLLKSKQGTIVV